MNLTELKQFLKRVEFLKGTLPEPHFIISVKDELHTIFKDRISTKIDFDSTIFIELYDIKNHHIHYPPILTVKGTNLADVYITFIKQIIKYEEDLLCQA